MDLVAGLAQAAACGEEVPKALDIPLAADRGIWFQGRETTSATLRSSVRLLP